jgi:predicted ATPase
MVTTYGECGFDLIQFSRTTVEQRVRFVTENAGVGQPR